jgi:ribosomal protein S18 acetylase RimI-like enzyme
MSFSRGSNRGDAGPVGAGMTTLVAMSRETFAAFAAEANEGYAQDHVVAGNWSADEAPAKAKAQFDQLLPNGFDTPDHWFYDVHDLSGAVVGAVWFGIVGVGEAKAGYVYNIRIRPDQQRKGYGRTALQALEELASQMGLPALRLNVFGHNRGAEALYRSLGYKVASLSMRKPLT